MWGQPPSAVASSEARQGLIPERTQPGCLTEGARHEPVPRSTLSGMMPKPFIALCATILLSLTIGGLAFAQASKRHPQAVQQKPFGTQDGRPVTLYTLTNAHGVEIDTMNYGGIILSSVPDRKGQFADIVLGHETLEGYIPNPPYLGRWSAATPTASWVAPSPRRQDLHPAQERRPQHIARWHRQDIQQGGVGWRAAERQSRRRLHLSQQRR